MDTINRGLSGDSPMLLRSIAEELKLPLIQIARTAVLQSRTGQSTPVDLKHIQTSADMALILVDNYLLGLELYETQTELELVPVSVSGILSETAHMLHDYAGEYQVDLELASAGKCGLVMAHASGLKAALFSLGYTLVGTTPIGQGRQRITLGVHQSTTGIVAGVYGDFEGLASRQLQQARRLYGRVQQPFQALAAGSVAGVFVADMIFQAMESKLYVSRHQKQAGLAAALQPSKQLMLV